MREYYKGYVDSLETTIKYLNNKINKIRDNAEDERDLGVMIKIHTLLFIRKDLKQKLKKIKDKIGK